MGLNRFYTFNGQILKTAEGNPIGFHYSAYPEDNLYARWAFDNVLTDDVSSRALGLTGTGSYIAGPSGSGYLGYQCDSGSSIFWPGPEVHQIFFNPSTSRLGSVSFWSKGGNTNDSFVLLSRADALNDTGLGMRGGFFYLNGASISEGVSTADWTHWVVTWQVGTGGQFKVYKNNVLTDTGTSGTGYYTNGTWGIGFGKGGIQTNEKSIALFYVYTDILGAEDIAKLYVEGGGTV